MIISARCAACALICHSSPAKFPSLSFSFSFSISFSILSPFLSLYLILYSLTLSISLSHSLFSHPLYLTFIFPHPMLCDLFHASQSLILILSQSISSSFSHLFSLSFSVYLSTFLYLSASSLSYSLPPFSLPLSPSVSLH